MGGDLICYIAKGRKVFTATERRRVSRWLGKLWPVLKRANSEDPSTIVELQRVLRGLRLSECKRHLTICVGDSEPNDYYLEDVISSYRWLQAEGHTTRARFLKAFLDFWERSAPRDTCIRDDPDDDRQQIVVAGEISWGDEPEGYGYQMLKAAHYLQLMPLLGIR